MPGPQREVLSVGIDVGTTTTQVVFSHLLLRDVARPGQVPRIQVDEKSVVHRGEVHATPLAGPDLVDADTLAALVRREYAAAGISAMTLRNATMSQTSSSPSPGRMRRPRSRDAGRALRAGPPTTTSRSPASTSVAARPTQRCSRWAAT